MTRNPNSGWIPGATPETGPVRLHRSRIGSRVLLFDLGRRSSGQRRSVRPDRALAAGMAARPRDAAVTAACRIRARGTDFDRHPHRDDGTGFFCGRGASAWFTSHPRACRRDGEPDAKGQVRAAAGGLELDRLELSITRLLSRKSGRPGGGGGRSGGARGPGGSISRVSGVAGYRAGRGEGQGEISQCGEAVPRTAGEGGPRPAFPPGLRGNRIDALRASPWDRIAL